VTRDDLRTARATGLLGVATLVVVLFVAFGQTLECTTEYLCTTERCAAACAWPDRAAVAGLVVVGLITAAACLTQALAARPHIAPRDARFAIAVSGGLCALLAYGWRV